MSREINFTAPFGVDGLVSLHGRCDACVVGASGSGVALLRRTLEAQAALGRRPQPVALSAALMAPQKSPQGEHGVGEAALSGLLREHPGLRIIHVIRDGRDCYAHLRQVGQLGPPDGLLTPECHAIQWMDAVRSLRRDAVIAPAYLEVKFEDLVLHAADTLERIRIFLGLAQPRVANLPVGNATQVQRWRETLLPDEVARFEAIASPLLGECGYPSSFVLHAHCDEEVSRTYLGHSLAALKRRAYGDAKHSATLALRAQPHSPECQHSLLSLAEWGEDLAVQWCMDIARDTALATRFENRLQAWRGETLDATHRLFIWRSHRDLGADLRYSAILANLGARASYCTVAVDARLVPLMERRFPELAIIPDTAAPPAGTAYHASWELLGHFLMPSPDAMPDRPWLEADPRRVTAGALGRHSLWRRPRVAIAWHSSNDRKDLPPLETWKPLLQVPGISWISAQYNADHAGISELERAGGPIRVESSDFQQDLEALAALLVSCDLLVSISGSQVHLAGALGVPVWVVMREVPLLSWPLGKDACCWYPHTQCHWVRDESWEVAMRALARRLHRWSWQWRLRRGWAAVKALNLPAGRRSGP